MVGLRAVEVCSFSALPAIAWIEELQLVGVSHETAGLELRSAIALNPEKKAEFLRELILAGATEGIAISTCNRTEIYLCGGSSEWVIERLATQSGLSSELIRGSVYTQRGWQAVAHLFSVASGLRSAAVGESEILGQLKAAFEIARQSGSLGRRLSLVSQRALRAAKRVRTESGLGRRGLSLGAAAARRALSLTHREEHRSILLIGSGQIAESVAKNLFHRRSTKVTVCSRSLEHAQRLAEPFGFEHVGWELLSESIGKSNIIISAVTADLPVVGREALTRHAAPNTVLIDLGVPPNIETPAQDGPPIRLVRIDELMAEVAENSKAIQDLQPVAESLVRDEVSTFADECAEREAAQCIQAMVRQGEEVRQQNLEWALAQLPLEMVRERKLLEDLSIRIIRGMLNRPIESLKADFRAPEERAVLARFLGAEA